MNTERPITEDDLHAFVDGALDQAEHARVEDYLNRHPDVAERIAAYAGQRDSLRAALAGIAQEPIPPELSLAGLIEARQIRDGAKPERRPWYGEWRTAAAGLALLIVGGASGWSLHGLATPRQLSGIGVLAQEAADSYAVYGPDHVRPVELRADASDELVKWVSGRLHRPVAVPDLKASGYRFMGGRLVATAHGPAALFMYDDDHGTRLVMMVRPMTVDKEDVPMSEHLLGDTGTVAWSQNGVGYSLAGPASATSLHPLADEVRRQINTNA
jgi:anti-sigma factor RsiW